MKQIQIPEELFILLMKYHLLDMEEAQPEIKKGLMDKMDSITMRLLFSQYKTAPTEDEKRKARQEYLDRRWSAREFPLVNFSLVINRSVARPCFI